MAQNSLVFQLQELASSDDTPITELLRRSLVVAVKLGLDDFKVWIEQELYGYKRVDSCPDYRSVHTELCLCVPPGRMIPWLITDDRVMELFCKVPYTDSVSAIEMLIQTGSESNPVLHIPFSPKEKEVLMDFQRQSRSFGPLFEPCRTFGPSQIAAILDAVRTTILNWSLELEKQGILGEGMSFNKSEKEAAKQHIHFHNCHNVQSIVGDVSESKVIQNTQMIVKGDFASLRRHLESNGIPSRDVDDLEKAITDDPRPKSSTSFGPKVSTWIGSMVTKASSGMLEIGTGAMAGMLGDALSKFFGF